MYQFLVLVPRTAASLWLDAGGLFQFSHAFGFAALIPVLVVLGAAFTSVEFHRDGESGFRQAVGHGSGERVLIAGSAFDLPPYLRKVAFGRKARCVGFLNARPDGTVLLRSDNNVRHYENLSKALIENAVDELLVVSADAVGDPVSIASLCAERGVTFRTVVDASLHRIGQHQTEVLPNGRRLFSVVSAPQSKVRLSIKRGIDIIGALFGLVLCAFAYLLYASRIRRETGGSVFFKQVRVGRNGRLFRCFKFRSMRVDAELSQAAIQSRSKVGCAFIKVKNDDRITPTGKILRSRYIDELPQFWNVLRGDMSLVGPRPSQPVEVATYSQHHFRRLSMKPGMTGLFQIRGHSAVAAFDDVVRLDCEYIDRWSVWLDLSIIAKTVSKLFVADGW